MAKKKYTLYKADGDEDGPAPCAFFLSPAGCRNGDNCKFAHILPDDGKSKAKATPTKTKSTPKAPVISSTASISSSDISSESEDEAPPPKQVTTKTKAKKTKATKKATPTTPKTVTIVEDDMFLPHGQHSASTPVAPNSESDKKKRKRNSDPFAKPKKSAATPTAEATPKSNQKKAKVVKKQDSFRDLDLPVASFQLPSAHATLANLPIASPSAIMAKKATPKEVKYPIPDNTEEGRKWKSAVLATRANPKYKSDFDYDKAKEIEHDELSSLWFKASPFGKDKAGNPHAIAIDCEMCETVDPVSGAKNSKALCRLSIVNAVNPDEVLIDTLVKPKWPVVDHRSRINGIKKEHLENVEFTLDHAQAFMKALCSNETVIIGHAVHNDLIALKMEHHCCVDSAMLFSIKDEPGATCSLKDLAFSVLNREMPDVHDSVNDASVALSVIEEGYVKTNGKPEPITRTFSRNRRSDNANNGADQLFVHRIPKCCTPDHISKMFMNHTSVQPTEVPDVEFNSDTGKTTVTFASVQHANLAFNALAGEPKPDKTGRMQKRVYLRTGGYIAVRKMIAPKKSKTTKE